MLNDYEKRDDKITYSQAMNLAVDYLAIVKDQFETPEDRQNAVLKMREWFYWELSKVPPKTAASEPGYVPTKPKRTYKSDKQEIFMRNKDEITGEFETPATLDAVFGNGAEMEKRG